MASGSPTATTAPTAAASAPGTAAQVPAAGAQTPGTGAKSAKPPAALLWRRECSRHAQDRAKPRRRGRQCAEGINTSKGYYDPSTIELKAGIPAEITFTQSSGCLQQVESADLGFSEDLSTGPKTIKLGALTAGTYGFNCGMQMQFGTIVVK